MDKNKLDRLSQLLHLQTPDEPSQPLPRPRGIRQYTRLGLAPMLFHTVCIYEPREPLQNESRRTYFASAQSQRPLIVSPGVVFQPKPPKQNPPSQNRLKK